jgi:hypothetical protein
MVHVPAAIREAVVPDTVQIEGVEDAKLTVRPDVADALSGNVVFTACDGTAPKVIACGSRSAPQTSTVSWPGQVAPFT